MSYLGSIWTAHSAYQKTAINSYVQFKYTVLNLLLVVILLSYSWCWWLYFMPSLSPVYLRFLCPLSPFSMSILFLESVAKHFRVTTTAYSVIQFCLVVFLPPRTCCLSIYWHQRWVNTLRVTCGADGAMRVCNSLFLLHEWTKCVTCVWCLLCVCSQSTPYHSHVLSLCSGQLPAVCIAPVSVLGRRTYVMTCPLCWDGDGWAGQGKETQHSFKERRYLNGNNHSGRKTRLKIAALWKAAILSLSDVLCSY